MNCLSNCCLSQQNDSKGVCAEDLQILSIRMLCEVKCTRRCVFSVWWSVVCATIRLNPQLSLTGLAEWTAEVYHCLLISTDSHQPIRAGHSPSGSSGNQLLFAWLNVSGTLQSSHPRKSQISQSYQGQQMLPSFPSCVKNTVWLNLKWKARGSI